MAIELPIIDTPPAAGETINCLRCRHAKLIPQTDFGYENVPIFCALLERNLPLRLNGCEVADPRRYLARVYRQRDPRTHGDFMKTMTRMERAFLRYHYPRSPLEFMLRATGREAGILRILCNRMQVFRAAEVIKRGREWPQPQRAYVDSCVNSTFWTKRGWGSKTARARQAKAAIVARVAELGPPRTWLEIRKYAKSLTPAYYARKARKTARHKELMEERLQERLAMMTPARLADYQRRSDGLRRGRERRAQAAR